MYKCIPDGIKNEDIDKRDSVLLRIIQLTPEQQVHDDRVGAERAVSTTTSFLKDKYKLSELRLVYRALCDIWNTVIMGQGFQKKGNTGQRNSMSPQSVKGESYTYHMI